MNLPLYLNSVITNPPLTNRHISNHERAKRQAKTMETVQVPGERHGINL